MIESILLSLAFSSGNLAFEEKDTHYRLFVRWGGIKISVATVSKEQLEQARKPKLEVVA